MMSEGIKDANDLLVAMQQEGLSDAEQSDQVQAILDEAPTYVELVCSQAGRARGGERDELIKKAFELVARMERFELSSYKEKLAKSMIITTREFNSMIKAACPEDSKKGKDEDKEEFIETPGGWIDEHLVEMLYDPESNETSFAIRFPDGKITTAGRLDSGGKRYLPMRANMMFSKRVVLFPSRLGLSKSVKELVAIIRLFIHRYLDIDDKYEHLASYYVLFSWVYDAFEVVPYLRALGDYGTGKSRFLQTIGVLCYRPIFSGGASTVSPIFRMIDLFKGTLILDEADFTRSDESADITKILNCGYMKYMPVLRTAGDKNNNFTPEAFEVYGPKLLATRKTYQDKALESRCLTKKMGGGVPRPDVPPILPKDFWNQALEIRNLLLMHRMKYLQPNIEVDYNGVDRAIEPRLNQVTMSLKTIMGDDQDMRNELDEFIRAYNKEMIIERSMLMEAKVLEALLAIKYHVDRDPSKDDGQPSLTLHPEGASSQGPLRSAHADLGDGSRLDDLKPDDLEQFSLTNICNKANEIIDSENAGEDTGEEESDDEGGSGYKKKSWGKKRLKPKGVGYLVREKLQLQTERFGYGPKKGSYYVIWDQERISSLRARYGL